MVAASSSLEEDGGLFPATGGRDDDRVDPWTAVEPVDALGEQRPSAERRERLRPIETEALAGAAGDDERPGGFSPELSLTGFQRAGTAGRGQALAAAAFGFALELGFVCPARERTSSSQAAACSSSCPSRT